MLSKGHIRDEQGGNFSVYCWVGHERTHRAASAGETPEGTGPGFLVASVDMKTYDNFTESTDSKSLSDESQAPS